jgi:hypothetical protein
MLNLENFWINMKGVRRKSSGLISPDWMALGFQGENPSTDFRAMGALGLFQLLYFSQHRTQTARMILEESSNKDRYFPFAAAGINITQFVMEMFVETRFHKPIFNYFESLTSLYLSHFKDGISTDENCVQASCSIIHNVYCDIFEEFYMLWVRRGARDMMTFSIIFFELKETLKEKYSVL